MGISPQRSKGLHLTNHSAHGAFCAIGFLTTSLILMAMLWVLWCYFGLVIVQVSDGQRRALVNYSIDSSKTQVTTASPKTRTSSAISSTASSAYLRGSSREIPAAISSDVDDGFQVRRVPSSNQNRYDDKDSLQDDIQESGNIDASPMKTVDPNSTSGVKHADIPLREKTSPREQTQTDKTAPGNTGGIQSSRKPDVSASRPFTAHSDRDSPLSSGKSRTRADDEDEYMGSKSRYDTRYRDREPSTDDRYSKGETRYSHDDRRKYDDDRRKYDDDRRKYDDDRRTYDDDRRKYDDRRTYDDDRRTYDDDRYAKQPDEPRRRGDDDRYGAADGYRRQEERYPYPEDSPRYKPREDRYRERDEDRYASRDGDRYSSRDGDRHRTRVTDKTKYDDSYSHDGRDRYDDRYGYEDDRDRYDDDRDRYEDDHRYRTRYTNSDRTRSGPQNTRYSDHDGYRPSDEDGYRSGSRYDDRGRISPTRVRDEGYSSRPTLTGSRPRPAMTRPISTDSRRTYDEEYSDAGTRRRQGDSRREYKTRMPDDRYASSEEDEGTVDERKSYGSEEDDGYSSRGSYYDHREDTRRGDDGYVYRRPEEEDYPRSRPNGGTRTRNRDRYEGYDRESDRYDDYRPRKNRDRPSEYDDRSTGYSDRTSENDDRSSEYDDEYEGRGETRVRDPPTGDRTREYNRPTDTGMVDNPPKRTSTSSGRRDGSRPLSAKEVIETALRQSDKDEQDNDRKVSYPVFDPRQTNLTSSSEIKRSDWRGITVHNRRKRRQTE